MTRAVETKKNENHTAKNIVILRIENQLKCIIIIFCKLYYINVKEV